MDDPKSNLTPSSPNTLEPKELDFWESIGTLSPYLTGAVDVFPWLLSSLLGFSDGYSSDAGVEGSDDCVLPIL